MIKVLIVGFGSIAKKHINALKRNYPEIIIIALRSSPNNKTVDNIQNIYSLDEIKNESPFDFAIISNPTSKHAKTIVELSALNIPLFIEKPVTSNLKEAEEVLAIIKNNKIQTYIACNLRFLDCIKEVKKFLPTLINEIEEISVYAGSYLPDWRPNVDYKGLYSANKEMGGGVHLDLIHEIDYIYWLFGEPNNTLSYLRSTSSLKINAIDYAFYLMDYEKFPVTIQLNYFRKTAKRSIEIVTSKGIYEVNLLTNSIVKDGIQIYKSDQQIIDTYCNQMNYFINCIKGNTQLMNNFEEARQVLNICINS